MSWVWQSYGNGDASRFRAIELITIFNRCHRFQGFVYQHASFTRDNKSIEMGCGQAGALRRSVRAVMRQRPATINSASRFSSSFPCEFFGLPSLHHAACELPRCCTVVVKEVP